MNPDQCHPQIQTPLVDCWDLEARYLRKFPGDLGSHLASVTQIPFQLYSYRVLEREKMNPTNSKESSSTEASESEVEDPPNAVIIRDTKSLCLDTISEYSDTRSVYSEAPIKKVSASKNSDELVKLRKSPSLGLFFHLSVFSTM